MLPLTFLLALPPPPIGSSATGTDIPTISASDLPSGVKPMLLPPHLPGYDLRVLDERKPLTLETPGGKVEVLLPIYFYFPADDRREGLRLLREATDELRHATHSPEPAAADLDSLLGRMERGLDLLGSP